MPPEFKLCSQNLLFRCLLRLKLVANKFSEKAIVRNF